MSSLDNKLREILARVESLGNAHPRLLDEIKQAFKEAGYMQHDEFGVVKTYTHKATNVLTGQEWYDRFIKELDAISLPSSDWESAAKDHYIFKAAKRAAGLEE